MDNRTVRLNSGYECPLLGYGTWQSLDERALKIGIKEAIAAGYRHIDTAYAYQNEPIIGSALKEIFAEGKIKREDIFITTKILPIHFEPSRILETLKLQLGWLKSDYVDLYLMHFPTSIKPSDQHSAIPLELVDGIPTVSPFSLEESWRDGMEKCVELGMAKSIGISNFNIMQVDRLCKSRIKPAMNQVELHPLFQNKKLVDHCRKVGVTITAYSAFGSPGSKDPNGNIINATNILDNKILTEVGKKYNKNPSHVILRWLIQQGIAVIPKSLTPSRIRENFNIWDFQLSDQDLETIAAIDENKRIVNRGIWLSGLKQHPEFPFTLDWKSY